MKAVEQLLEHSPLRTERGAPEIVPMQLENVEHQQHRGSIASGVRGAGTGSAEPLLKAPEV
jgi:hypothetical protein